MTYVVLAPYPLSAEYASGLREELGGEIVLLDLPTLRRLGSRALLNTLFSHRGRNVAIALEDDSSTVLLPVLELLGMMAVPRRIEVLDASLARTNVGRLSIVRSAGRLGRATIDARLAMRRARRELAALELEPRGGDRCRPGNRVLYVNGNLWFGVKAGGSIGHVAGVINTLLQRGYDVDVAAVARQPLVDEAAGFVQLDPPDAFGLPPEANQYVFSQRTATLLSRRLTSTSGYAFCYQRLSLANYAGLVATRSAGVPLVIEYNGSEVWVARHWGRPLADERLALSAEDATLRHATLVVTVSNALRDELVERGIDRTRIVAYPNGVDPHRFTPDAPSDVRSRYGFTDDDVVVGFIGTFGRWHGVEVLARAITRLAVEDEAWLERNRVRFLLVGDGLRMGDVKRALASRAAGRVVLPGLVPQAEGPSYLAAMDVLVSPHVRNADGSAFFGSPTKLFEYMAMGRSILASRLDQIADVLDPALDARALPDRPPVHDEPRLAMLVEPGDEQALVDGIRFLVERPDWRTLLGANARRRILERHTWAHHVDRILDGLRNVGS